MSGETGSVIMNSSSDYTLSRSANCVNNWAVELHRVRPISSSPIPYAVFAPILFEFDPTKTSSPPDSVMSKWVALCRKLQTSKNQDKFWIFWPTPILKINRKQLCCSRTLIIRTSIIRISRLSEIFLWSQFYYEYLLVMIEIRSHNLFRTTALKSEVKASLFRFEKA